MIYPDLYALVSHARGTEEYLSKLPAYVRVQLRISSDNAALSAVESVGSPLSDES